MNCIDENQEKIIVNLKIISKIKENDKVNTNNKYFSIINKRWSFLRQFLNENRKTNLIKISEEIKKAFNLIERYYVCIDNNKEKDKQCLEKVEEGIDKLTRSLIESVDGLKKLKETYKNDITISCQIEFIIETITDRFIKNKK